MRNAEILRCLGLFLVAQTGPAQDTGASSPSLERGWQPADTVAVRYYSNSVGAPDATGVKKAISISPSGKYFWVMSTNGSVVDDCLVQILEIFDSAQVESFFSIEGNEPRPLPICTLERQNSRRDQSSPIRDVQWEDDESGIFYIGHDELQQEQIYRLDIASGRARELTNDSGRKRGAVVASDSFIYLREYKTQSAIKKADTYPMTAIPVDENGQAIFGAEGIQTFFDLTAGQRGQDPWVIASSPWFYSSRCFFSHDQKYAVMIVTKRVSASSEQWSSAFLFLDFARKVSRPISDEIMVSQDAARFRSNANILWSHDDTRVAILDVPTLSGQPERVGEHLFIFDLKADRLERFETNEEVNSAFGRFPWLSPLLTNSRRLPRTKTAGGLSVTIVQGSNMPPHIVVSDGKKQKTLSGLDPALQRITRASIEPISWRTADGREISSPFVRPSVRSGTGAPPLIIQISPNASFDRFYPDMDYIFPGQALAARGFAVLSLNVQPSGRNSPTEGPEMVRLIDDVVTVLAKNGLADPKRVGLLGFSRTGFQALYVSTHPGSTPITAFCTVDSTLLSFQTHLRDALYRWREPEKNYGGLFWGNEQTWLTLDPIFNIDRMDAAALFIYHNVGTRGAGTSVDEYDSVITNLLGALVLTNRKYEMLFTSEAPHAVIMPRQRVAELEAMVDWMSYWMLGVSDPNPTKREQYERWNRVRNSGGVRAPVPTKTLARPEKGTGY